MTRAYLIETDAGLYLVDTGPPGCIRSILRRMRRIGRDDLRFIFVTHAHFDHYGNAAEIRRHTGAPVAVHRADAEAMTSGETRVGTLHGWGNVIGCLKVLVEPFTRPVPTQPDILLGDGDRLDEYGLDAKVVHTPGHTPGSSSLFVDGRLAFVGDLISTSIRPHVQCFLADDWSRIPESLRRVLALEPERVYPGHGRRTLGLQGLQKLIRRSS